jgi:hypothetical protein
VAALGSDCLLGLEERPRMGIGRGQSVGRGPYASDQTGVSVPQGVACGTRNQSSAGDYSYAQAGTGPGCMRSRRFRTCPAWRTPQIGRSVRTAEKNSSSVQQRHRLR